MRAARCVFMNRPPIHHFPTYLFSYPRMVYVGGSTPAVVSPMTNALHDAQAWRSNLRTISWAILRLGGRVQLISNCTSSMSASDRAAHSHAHYK